MPNSEDIDRAKRGRGHWNIWAEERRKAGEPPVADFSGAGAEIAGISFENFVFPGEAKFSGTVFSQAVSFRAATFHGDANFNDTRFEVSACFDHAEFRLFTDFSHARFEQLSVSGAEFSREANFEHAWFNRSHFTGVAFKHALTRFTEASFRHVPDFRATTFETPPLFQRVNVEYARYQGPNFCRRWMSCAAGDDDAVKFRRLKELAADWRDHERELEFFANELRAKRFYETKSFGGIALNWAYDQFFNFGRSIWRPITGLAVLTCLAWLLIMPTYSTIWAATWEQDKAGWVLSLTNWALLLGADKWDTRTHAFETLCQSCRFGPGAALLAYVQSAASLILLFLLGLGLRNRFRIGST